MSGYALVKSLHVLCALLSAVGFVLQGFWMLTGSRWRRHPAVRWLPHWIDTALLTSALILVGWSGQWPWRIDWLGVKVTLVGAYIVCGFLAISRWSEKRWRLPVRGVLFAVALTILAQIGALALTRHPAGLWQFAPG